MTTQFKQVTLPIALVLTIGAAWLTSAGDLNPPPGPIVPTGRFGPRTDVATLPGDNDALHVINQPGAYYLSGNITGVADKNGIEIHAGGVTLDLNGFDLVGVPGMGFFDGVTVTVAGLTNIAVVNGSIRNWGDEGLNFVNAGAANCRVSDVLASGNAGSGFFVGNATTLANCSAYNNGRHGIAVFFGCTITHCTASNNAEHGISTNSYCTIADCSASFNTFSGILTTTGCTVTGCSAGFNTLDGIRCSTACLIRGNTCSSNGAGAGDGAGIHVTGTDNRIEGNNCATANRGIDVDAEGNLIVRNSAAGNTTNYDIVAGNAALVISAVTGGAILGDSGGVGLGSTDPWANFAY